MNSHHLDPSDELSVCAANEFERTGTQQYPGATMRRLGKSLRPLKFSGARYYWYAGEQSALEKHAEDRKYLTDTDRIRTLLKDVSTKLQEQSEFSSNVSHVGSWATYFNDRLKLRDGLGALDPNTSLFRHLTPIYLPSDSSARSFAVAVEWASPKVKMTTVGLK